MLVSPSSSEIALGSATSCVPFASQLEVQARLGPIRLKSTTLFDSIIYGFIENSNGIMASQNLRMQGKLDTTSCPN
jgi:hypothetical protein